MAIVSFDMFSSIKETYEEKNVKCPLKILLKDLVLIPFQHDQKIRRPAIHIVCTHFQQFLDVLPDYFVFLNFHFVCQNMSLYLKLIVHNWSVSIDIYLITVMPFTTSTLSIRQSGSKCMNWLSIHQPADFSFYLNRYTINHYNQQICMGNMMLRISQFLKSFKFG